MVRCQHPFGLCAQDGFCHYGGSCFRNQLEEWLATSSNEVLIKEKLAIEGELKRRHNSVIEENHKSE